MLSFRILTKCGYAHQAAQTKSWQFHDRLGELQDAVGANSGLGFLSVNIDLNTYVQRVRINRPLFAKSLGYLEAVEGMHPSEMFGDQARLVALDMADKVPDQVVPTRRCHLVDTFSCEVLAKIPLPGRYRLQHRCGAVCLARSEQPHRIRTPVSLDRSFCQQILDISKVFRDSYHVLPRVLRYTRLRSSLSYGKSNCTFRGRNMAVDVAQLLSFSVKNNASDLHLSSGVPPMIRVDGDIKRINMPALTHKDVNSMVYDIMNDKQRKDYEEYLETDFSFEIPKLARFRVNAFNQNRGSAAVFRTIPSEILTLDDLGAPPIFKDLSMLPRGLVLVTGPTGSGKSTTLAAMVDHINDNKPDHILTIEDPIEFVHESKKSLINQREVHRDTLGFNEALRSALREDPDVILVGELRDLETIRLALTAAETGHLVFGTLHTSSAAKTIDRIVDVFPAAEKEMVRAMLSESLRAVISQTLLKKIGGGRIAAHEIMIGTPAIRNLIREGKIAQMYSAIQTGQGSGMYTLDQNLAELMSKGLINKEEARYRAVSKENF